MLLIPLSFDCQINSISKLYISDVRILNFFEVKNFYFPKNFAKFLDFFPDSLHISLTSLISSFVAILYVL